MIAFRALVWRQTATLWWRTRETTAWRSTSISSRPSSTWSEDLQVSPEDRHLLGLWYFKWSLVVWRVDVLFMIATVNDHNHYTEVHRWEWSSTPLTFPAPFQSLSRNDSYEDNLRERDTDLQAFQVEAPWAPTLLVKTYLSRSVLCQIDKHHNINHVFKQLFVVLFGQHAKITNYNHVAYWICMTDNEQNDVDIYSIEYFLYLVPSNTSNLCGPWADKQKGNEIPWAPSGKLPWRGRSRRKWSLSSCLARARLGRETFLCSCSCRGWLHGSSPILARSSRSSSLCLTRGQTLTLRTRWS